MIRVAFTLVDSSRWTGGYNYLLNLMRAIDRYGDGSIGPVLFTGSRISDGELSPFRRILSTEVVESPTFDALLNPLRVLSTLVRRVDHVAERTFVDHHIDVVFEAATFYGSRLAIPAIAWIPDFQHRNLPGMFSFAAYWKREFGFRVQIASGRLVMLSSEHARADCERFYPSACGNTAVVPFAVTPEEDVSQVDPREIVREYRLPSRFFLLPNQFWRHKNHTVVMKATRIALDRGQEIVVAALGNVDTRRPEYYKELQATAARLRIADHFRFLGMVPRQHLIALLRTCTAMINPSLFEGWSTTVEEAKSLGAPLILSDIPVHREQAEATFFPPGSPQALAEALGNMPDIPVELRVMRERTAREQAQERVAAFVRAFGRTLELTRRRQRFG